MFKRRSSNCQRCGAVLLRNANVCAACCSPQTSAAPQVSYVTERQPVAVSVPSGPPQPQTGLSAWPFGQADAEATAQAAALAGIADVRNQLSHYSAQSTTHVLGGIPAQRPAQRVEEVQSVPSYGPNPFLAAARREQARDEATAGAGYPA